MTRSRSGFTLVEILIVIVVLGILAAVVVPQFSSASNDTYTVVANGFHRALTSGISVYLLAQKKYPTSFWSWVSVGGDGSKLNSVFIDKTLRNHLTDPNANVLNGTAKVITLNFKNGLTGVYTIADGGVITATYTGP